MPRAAKPVVPECPRCGYDVSGTISTWESACPLAGRCTECGYGFQWKHLLGPHLGVPTWFFETARRKKIRAAISTSVRTLLPWKFWREVPLHAPVTVGRLCLLVCVSLIVAYCVSVVCMTLPRFLTSLAPGPLRQRWWGWSGTPPSLLERMARFLRNDVSYTARWPIVLEVGSLPKLFSVVTGAWAIALGLMPACFLTVRRTLRTQRVRFTHVIRTTGYAVVAFAAFACVCFLVVLVRLSLYAWAPFQWPYTVDTVLWHAVARAWVAWPVVLTAWWWCVCRFYLRIRHAFWVAFLLVVMATLGAMVIMYSWVTDISFWTDMFLW